jgi:polyhydroxyalkanoate synthase
MYALRRLVDSPLCPLPIRAFAAGSIEPAVLDQHVSLAMDAGSLVVLKDLVLGGIESQQSGHSKGGLLGCPDTFDGVDLPLLVIAGTRDELAPVASVQPAFEHSRSRDKTYRTFPRGHIDLLVGRDAPNTVWPTLEAWIRRRAVGR